MSNNITITDEAIIITIPKRGTPGRGVVAYLLYLLDPGSTWESGSAHMGLTTNQSWVTARRWARKAGRPWPPKLPPEGRPGRPWQT